MECWARKGLAVLCVSSLRVITVLAYVGSGGGQAFFPLIPSVPCHPTPVSPSAVPQQWPSVHVFVHTFAASGLT